jgi:hypothetical protein
MENINPEVNNAALFCGRMTFKESNLTVSVNGRGKTSLLATVMMFAEYFGETFPGKKMEKLELFLCESDMHEGKKAWQTTYFNDRGGFEGTAIKK